jgi:beta-1,2-mannobiose phosphorylase / 1,2-beta-oligomannan phosphorylase
MTVTDAHPPRTITATPPVQPRRLQGGQPVLGADPALPWASRVVLNPAAVLVEDSATLNTLSDRLALAPGTRARIEKEGGACVLLFRAQGEAEGATGHAPSRLGLALFTPAMLPLYVHDTPVIDVQYNFQNLGAEDARCSRIGDTFYLHYTGYSQNRWRPEAPRRVRICRATSQNLVDWILHGPVDGDLNEVDNKNPALFPHRVAGKWLMLHRPMEGSDAMAVHLAEAESPDGPWHSRGLLFASYTFREFEKSWVGAGGPPVALGADRFLMIYHQGHFTADGRREYDLAAALLDFRRTDPVVSRIEPLMRPHGELEQSGDPDLGVDNVLFTTGCYVWRDELVIPYAGADSRIFAASVPLQELLHALEGAAT